MNTINIRIVDFTPSFRDGGYVMSYVTQVVLHTRIIRLETDKGLMGYGEVVRYPNLDAAAVAAMEDAVLAENVDLSRDTMPALVKKIRDADVKLAGLAFGLETAYLDLLARAENKPLYDLLGGRLCKDVPDYLSLSCGEPAAMADRVSTDGALRTVIQAKLDGEPTDADVHRIDAILKAARPDQRLLFDFNGALGMDRAKGMVARYSDPRIMWEEPCKTYEENRDLAANTGAPVLFDQCLKTMEVIRHACDEGIMAAACIKPAFLGGLTVARAARDLCVDAGIAVRVDGPWCGPVATAAALHLAVGTPPEYLISGADLSEPLLLDEDWGGIIRTPDDRIAPGDGPGHSVTPKM